MNKGDVMKSNEKVALELRAAQDAGIAGNRYLALLRWLHAFLNASSTEREALCQGKTVTFLPWAFDRAPTAFLACFTKKDGDYVLPLKPGVNRLGTSLMADHTIPSSVHLMEERQWLLIHEVEGRTFVAGDRSSSVSALLRHDSEVLLVSPSLPAMRLATPRTEIDRGGDVLYPLTDGDVLVTFYGAFVFVMPGAKG
jgi:hypothetical protein